MIDKNLDFSRIKKERRKLENRILENKLPDTHDVSNLTNFQERVGEWADEKYNGATVQSILAHLQSEILELTEAPSDPYEAADVLLLLLHLAHRQGYDLLSATRIKLEVVKKRERVRDHEGKIDFI